MADELIYRIDTKDRIDYFNSEWLAFANHNGMKDPAAVIGRTIWDFISDRSTSEIYRAAYARVRATGAKETICFRCDSPDERRTIEMEIRRLANGDLEHGTRVVSVEKRPSFLLLDARAPRSEAIVLVCAWCSLVNVSGVWTSPEKAAAALGLVAGKPVPRLSHGACSACVDFQIGRRSSAA